MIAPVFLAHGSPYTIFEQSDFTDFLQAYSRNVQPKAIVIFSAHFESKIVSVTSTDDVHDIVYDYYGFPPEFYSVAYPARGSSIVAKMVRDRLEQAGIATQASDRGLDHGVFPILRHMYPAADIPVVAVSIDPFLPPQQQVRIGEALRGLDEQDILVIGSGFVVHNLRHFDRNKNAAPYPWAVEFVEWLKEKLLLKDYAALFDYMKLAPHAQMAVPRPEHFVPLFIALGAGRPESKPAVLYDAFEYGSGSPLSLSF